MEANNELTRAQLLASPPQSMEDVDAWFVRYNAVIDAARAEALRVERLRDAAPDLAKALTDALELIDLLKANCFDRVRVADETVAPMRAALAAAGAA